jgi:hypothetical protein
VRQHVREQSTFQENTCLNNHSIRKLARFMQYPGRILLLHLLRHLRLRGGIKFYWIFREGLGNIESEYQQNCSRTGISCDRSLHQMTHAIVKVYNECSITKLRRYCLVTQLYWGLYIPTELQRPRLRTCALPINNTTAHIESDPSIAVSTTIFQF